MMDDTNPNKFSILINDTKREESIDKYNKKIDERIEELVQSKKNFRKTQKEFLTNFLSKNFIDLLSSKNNENQKRRRSINYKGKNFKEKDYHYNLADINSSSIKNLADNLSNKNCSRKNLNSKVLLSNFQKNIEKKFKNDNKEIKNIYKIQAKKYEEEVKKSWEK